MTKQEMQLRVIKQEADSQAHLENGVIVASEYWTRRLEDGSIEHGAESVEFGPETSWQEIKNWLGY